MSKEKEQWGEQTEQEGEEEELLSAELQSLKLANDEIGRIYPGGNPTLLCSIWTENRYNKEMLKVMLKRLWTTKKPIQFEDITENLYLITFELEQDRKKVLSGCPWLFERQIVMLKELNEPIALKEVRMTSTFLWMHIRNIPVICKKERVVEMVGNSFARYSDMVISDSEVKLRVEVDIREPIRRGIFIESEEFGKWWLNFQYEKLPIFCFECGRMGHQVKQCKDSKGDSRNNDGRKMPFGLSLRAGSNVGGVKGGGGRGNRVDPIKFTTESSSRNSLGERQNEMDQPHLSERGEKQHLEGTMDGQHDLSPTDGDNNGWKNAAAQRKEQARGEDQDVSLMEWDNSAQQHTADQNNKHVLVEGQGKSMGEGQKQLVQPKLWIPIQTAGTKGMDNCYKERVESMEKESQENNRRTGEQEGVTQAMTTPVTLQIQAMTTPQTTPTALQEQSMIPHNQEGLRVECASCQKGQEGTEMEWTEKRQDAQTRRYVGRKSKEGRGRIQKKKQGVGSQEERGNQMKKRKEREEGREVRYEEGQYKARKLESEEGRNLFTNLTWADAEETPQHRGE